jgi:hypothetical protein
MFPHAFPFHTNNPGQLRLTPERISLVTSTLDGRRLPLQQWMTACKPKNGTTGLNFAATPVVTPTLLTPQNPSNNNSSLVSLLGSGVVTSTEEQRCKLKFLKQHSVTWRKRSCWLDTQTPVGPTDPKT